MNSVISQLSNRLTGKFPNEVVLLKNSLEVLDLGDNPTFTIGSEFNPYLAQLTNLREYRVEDTPFSSEDGIPTALGNLKNISLISAARTLYRGPLNGAAFPSDLTQLCKFT